MQDMRELERMGMVTPDYISELEDRMSKDDSLKQFGAGLENPAKHQTATTKNQKKRARKAQRKARKQTV